MRAALVVCLLGIAACGGDDAPPDAGTDAGSADLGSDAQPDLGGEPPDLGPDGACSVPDRDGDGSAAGACGGDDCDDDDASAYPGNRELCDATGHDDDCDPTTFGPDADGDGETGATCCNVQPSGPPHCGADCDDSRPSVAPMALEICNRLDDNCDGRIDEAVTTTCWVDTDRDGYALGGAPTIVDCFCADGLTATDPASASDCNDTDRRRSPGNPEVCNGFDDNCDGAIDEAATATWYPDCDRDFRGAGESVSSCAEPAAAPVSCAGGTWSTDSTDCDDLDATRYPGNAEACNGRDDDCDAVIDGTPASAYCTSRAPASAHVASAVCTTGACAVVSCLPGYADCNAGADCEVDCATCGGVCSWSCYAPTCDPVVSLGRGADHTCAVRASGTVYCWGANSYGQLGDGTTLNRYAPVAVVGVTDAIAVTGGAAFTCVLHRTGTVSCWGMNSDRQLGLAAPYGDRLVPGPTVLGLSDVVQLASGSQHSCARTSGGQAFCWGTNINMALGDGTTMARDGAVAVVGLGTISDIDVRAYYACGIRSSDSAVLCWGSGPLGDGVARTMPSGPVVVAGGHTATDIALGWGGACMVSGTQVWCWGGDGVLGNGPGAPDSCGGSPCALAPVRVTGISAAAEVVVNAAGACARLAGGAVWCWGGGIILAMGSGFPSDVPVAITGLGDATRLAAGQTHVCAQRTPGGISCWGASTLGQLGDGTATSFGAPVAVLHP